MEELELNELPQSLLLSRTYSFPLIRTGGLPAEFCGAPPRRFLTESVWPLGFEYSVPPVR